MPEAAQSAKSRLKEARALVGVDATATVEEIHEAVDQRRLDAAKSLQSGAEGSGEYVAELRRLDEAGELLREDARCRLPDGWSRIEVGLPSYRVRALLGKPVARERLGAEHAPLTHVSYFAGTGPEPDVRPQVRFRLGQDDLVVADWIAPRPVPESFAGFKLRAREGASPAVRILALLAGLLVTWLILEDGLVSGSTFNRDHEPKQTATFGMRAMEVEDHQKDVTASIPYHRPLDDVRKALDKARDQAPQMVEWMRPSQEDVTRLERRHTKLTVALVGGWLSVVALGVAALLFFGLAGRFAPRQRPPMHAAVVALLLVAVVVLGLGTFLKSMPDDKTADLDLSMGVLALLALVAAALPAIALPLERHLSWRHRITAREEQQVL